ncbi:hypothetical protein GX50_05875 [[Emmonsia] crescens]|uniref:Protein kinase domain-containing protein n=1 Tax=[Emmonsia] crescens TaxID=73230 RepID=A0A2B7ZBJ1_9EURO|nr:hypothetical protein GX50_05875 [Emmonsia crescens]
MPLGPENTIYRDETGFDENLKIVINFAEMELIAVLKKSEVSCIFHVNYIGEPRVLKVFHNNKDPGYASDGVRDLNRARCEIRAYCSLKRFKICDGGFVPKFYGYTIAINPISWEPHLNAFQHDIDLPSAILIEYLPNPLPMNSDTYSKKRFEKVNIGIQQIHLALIEHNDPYPKNVLIVPGDPERVVWIDFDVAIVYSNENYIGKRERGWIEFETRCVESYGPMLEKDQMDGLPPNSKYY